VVVISIFLVSCGGDDKNKFSPTWTFLVYVDGDNDLSEAAISDIAEMEAIGSTKNINIVVQLDLNGGVTTKRYRILKGSSELIADLGELDMASPETLTDFLKWAKVSYPADKTVLILWDHGNGWDQGDGPSIPKLKDAKGYHSYSLLIDSDNNSPFLSNHKVKDAIKDSEIKIDILGFDASIMGTIEVLYEFKDLSEVVISSQEVGESHGWDYTAILSALTTNPSMDIEELSKVIVDSYKAFFEDQFYPSNPLYERRHTISAFQTKYISSIANEVDMLAQRFINLIDSPESNEGLLVLIKEAREGVQEIDYYVQPYVYIDLVDLDRLLGQDTMISQLLSNATIAEYHGSARGNAHGLSIVFFKLPEAMMVLTYDLNYRNYDPLTMTGNNGDFINQFNWDEFLKKYYKTLGF